jgi:transposase InsO family protein
VVDDYTRITFVAGLRKKSDAATALIEIIEAAERQFEKCVKFLQTDQGGEFRSEELQQQLRSRGIIQKETVPRHSDTNPQIERANRTIVTMARIALLASGLPKKLWLEAARHAAYNKNRLPHLALGGKVPLVTFAREIEGSMLQSYALASLL